MAHVTRRALVKGAAGFAAMSTLTSLSARAANNPLQIGIVAKIRIPWFDNVEKGVNKAAQGPRRKCLDDRSDD